jgi:hypothetical protein
LSRVQAYQPGGHISLHPLWITLLWGTIAPTTGGAHG